jgi:hypothetical protein
MSEVLEWVWIGVVYILYLRFLLATVRYHAIRTLNDTLFRE